jgi:hypothetical protein
MAIRSVITKFEPINPNTHPGFAGELWVDNITGTLHLGDGATPGGQAALTYNFNGGGMAFPLLEVDLHNGGVQTGQVLQLGTAGYQAIITGPTPTGNDSAERLIIQGQRGAGSGEGGDVYFWGGDAEYNGGDIKIYAGNADNVTVGDGGYVNISGGDGATIAGDVAISGGGSNAGTGGDASLAAGAGVIPGNVWIYNNGYSWKFDADGTVTTPGNVAFPGNVLITPSQVRSGQGAGATGGYSFTGNEGGNDTGLFSPADGNVSIYSNTNHAMNLKPVSVANTADWTMFGTLQLIPQSSQPTGRPGMLAVCDGTAWNPGGDGNVHLLCYTTTWNIVGGT